MCISNIVSCNRRWLIKRTNLLIVHQFNATATAFVALVLYYCTISAKDIPATSLVITLSMHTSGESKNERR